MSNPISIQSWIVKYPMFLPTKIKEFCIGLTDC